jgi:Fe-S-cluster formation regulator IscX/YfhJ
MQTFESTADSQSINAVLLEEYEEYLSNSLVATDLRSELTLLRFDNKWKKSNEAFLLSMRSKILELEQLEDKNIED